jgi:hypothetical protein
MALDDGIDCAAGLLRGMSFLRPFLRKMIVIVMAAPDLFSAPSRVWLFGR